MWDLLCNFCRLSLKSFGSLMQHSFLFLIIFNNSVSCQCLDTTYTCCNTSLRNDFEKHDSACILDMCTTTELSWEISHGYNTYFLVVFLTKQSHCSGFLGFLNIHNVCHYRKSRLNFFVYKCFCLSDFFRCHCLKMCKVETKSVRSYKRTLLFYMRTENCFKCLLKKMCCTVIFLCITACLFVDFKSYCLPCGKHSGFHMSDMTEFTATKLDGILYHKSAICSLDHTTVTFLTTHGSVERCFFYKYSTFLTFHQRSCNFFLCRKNCDLWIVCEMIVAYKFCSYIDIDLIIYSGVSSHIVGYLTCWTRLHSLLFHCLLEAVFINSISLFLKDFFGKIKRESISIIQFECIVSGKSLFSGCLHLFFHISKNA